MRRSQIYSKFQDECHVQVLDLDETLVHSTLDGCDEPDFSFPVSFNGREHRVHVRRRPHLQPFLQRCAELFEVVVFTASQKVYAEQLLNILDPTRCAYFQGFSVYFYKPLIEHKL